MAKNQNKAPKAEQPAVVEETPVVEQPTAAEPQEEEAAVVAPAVKLQTLVAEACELAQTLGNSETGRVIRMKLDTLTTWVSKLKD